MRTQTVQWLRRIRNTTITYTTTVNGTTFDPVTGTYNDVATTVSEFVYVGEFTTQDTQLLLSLGIDNNLVLSSRKLISLTEYAQDETITIDSATYRIAFKQQKAGAFIYGIEKL